MQSKQLYLHSKLKLTTCSNGKVKNNSITEVNTSELLDSSQLMIEQGNVVNGMERLFIGLKTLCENSSSQYWEDFSRFKCLRHSIRNLLHEDPFTLRAFQKPRGYPGDALTLDYIYYPEKFMNSVKGLGKDISLFVSNSPAVKAVRQRRQILAEKIDEVAKHKTNQRILSLACGHLREVELSKSFLSGGISELVAIDQDTKSLEEVDKAYGDSKILNIIKAPVRLLISGELTLGGFDLVYSAGLFDYLSQPVAMKLTSVMFELLNKDGKVLIANFKPGINNKGHMETYMDWRLIYRDEEAMEELTRLIPQEQIAHKKIFVEENNNIIFLEITKT